MRPMSSASWSDPGDSPGPTGYCRLHRVVVGRVELWRGSIRFGLSVSAPFVWRCPSILALTPFPQPAHRTGRADLPHQMSSITFDAICGLGSNVVLRRPSQNRHRIRPAKRHIKACYKDRRNAISAGSLAHRLFAFRSLGIASRARALAFVSRSISA